MSEEIEKLRGQNFTSKRDIRLFKEWDMIDQRFRYGKDKHVEYYIRKTNGSGLPIVYEFHFKNFKTIIGINESDQTPIFGKEHVMRITLPNDYPAKGKESDPEFKFTTPVWHPQVQFYGAKELIGIVCVTQEAHGAYTSLVHYIDWIVDFLLYEDYNANAEIEPFPRDFTVARWVREQAEPNNWLNFTQD